MKVRAQVTANQHVASVAADTVAASKQTATVDLSASASAGASAAVHGALLGLTHGGA
jgi:hypothetical protein